MSTSKRKPPAPAPTYHHGNLRAALVAEGLVLLEESTNTEVSLRELTRRLGVSANAAYRHFHNKDALLAALAAEGFRLLAAQLAEALQKGKNPTEGFLQSGCSYVAFARAHPALFRLMFGRFTSTHVNDELEQAGQLAFHGLQRGLAASTGKRLSAADQETAALFAWALVHGLSHLALDGQLSHQRLPVDKLVAKVLGKAGFTGA